MTEGTLQERVNRLEDAVSDGLLRIENLIRQEIRDLKSEQLAEIKQTIDRVERDLKGDHERLADDQRRLWDRVSALERRENERLGGSRALHAIWVAASGMLGAGITFLVDKMR